MKQSSVVIWSPLYGFILICLCAARAVAVLAAMFLITGKKWSLRHPKYLGR